MEKFDYSLLFIAALLATTHAIPTTNFPWESGKFSVKLYKNIIENNSDKNVVVSPISIQAGLALAYLGADGATASEMSDGLRLDGNAEVVGRNFKQLMEHHAERGEVKIANKIYLDRRFEIRQGFRELATNQFNSAVEKLDMSDGDNAANVINRWVEQETNDKIQNIVAPGDVQGSATVLVNAVHFKADWKQPFNLDKTTKQSFWNSETESEEVDMMNDVRRIAYKDAEDYSAINLLYKDSDFSLLVILPKTRTGLWQTEAHIEDLSVQDLLNSMGNSVVDVKLPKFKTDFSVKLRPILERMGMGTMFTRSANFNKLSSSNIAISNVIHKTFFDVNERGTEAEPATADPVRLGEARWQKVFHADHPFLYLLVDSSGHVFFMGRYIKN